jgi:outer membrane immunogenic protein
MQKFVLGGFVVAALMSAPAMAADLPTKRMVSKAPIVAPMFSWTGFYIGANVGGAWGEADNQLSIVNGPPGNQFFNPALARETGYHQGGDGKCPLLGVHRRNSGRLQRSDEPVGPWHRG